MPRKPDPRQMSFNFDAVVLIEETVQDTMAVTPAMIEGGMAAIVSYDAAVRAGDFDAQKEAILQFRRVATIGQEYFSLYADNLHEAMTVALPLPDNRPPLFRQPFDRIIEPAGVRARVVHRGIGRLPLTGYYAVDEGPFISETGYRSLAIGRPFRSDRRPRS